MITVNTEKWPIVYAHFDGVNTPIEMENYLSQFDTWLERGEKFSIIVNQTNAELAYANPSQEVQKLEANWSRQNKPRIAEYCAGMAIVFDSVELVQKWQPIAAKATAGAFGCPGEVFSTITAAENWIQQQLSMTMNN